MRHNWLGILLLCALILPVVGGLLSSSRLAWIGRLADRLGKLAGVLLAVTVFLVSGLILYLAWQFSR